MLDLKFAIESAEPGGFRLLLTELVSEPTPIHSIALRCQVRIQPARRRYLEAEKERLAHLFGTPDLWGKTVRDILWAHTTVMVPSFTGETSAVVPMPHPSAAAGRYCDALTEGEIPLLFLFSGSVFYEAAGVGPQVCPIPWDREARYRLPATRWKDLFAEAA
jgi:hypothetical protein